MLNNLAHALRAHRKDAEAASVHERALTLAADNSTTNHRVWAALERACAGQSDGAGAVIADCAGAELSETQRAVLELAAIALQALRRRALPSYRALLAVRRRLLALDGTAIELYNQNAALRRARSRVVRSIARGRSGLQRLWIQLVW
jgi:hypothetical protein